jgi:hypothetical protein
MATDDEVVKLVQEAVRQYASDIQRMSPNTRPVITLSNAPPKVEIVSVMEGGSMPESIRLAHESAPRLAKRWAVCVETWDGYVTTADGERTDAILVNYWMNGLGPIFFIQRYKLHPFQWYGSALAGEDAAYLKT